MKDTTTRGASGGKEILEQLRPLRSLKFVNKTLENYDHIYIYNVTWEAKYIFYSLFYSNVTVDAFISDHYAAFDISLYNKPILNVKEVFCKKEGRSAVLVAEEDYEAVCSLNIDAPGMNIFVDADRPSWYVNKKDVFPLYEINSELLEKSIYIYGCGFFGKETYHLLSDLGYKVAGFCDSNKEKVGGFFLGKQVISRDELLHRKDVHVIVAATVWNKIIDGFTSPMLCNVFVDFFRFNVYQSQLPYRREGEWAFFSDHSLWLLIRFCKGKTIYLYGDVAEGAFASNLLDKCGETRANFIESIDDLYYDDEGESLENKMVLLCGRTPTYIEEKLISMGMSAKDNYLFMKPLLGHKGGAVYQKDVMMGNTYVVHSEYPGFTRFGNGGMRIVTLGGSTSDSQLYNHKCWSEILYEMYKACGMPVEIFSGGMAFYTSGNELVKLVRDVFRFNPDVVISYSGINDMTSAIVKGSYRDYPFLNGSMMDRLENCVPGMPDSRDAFEIWLDNECCMEALCKSKGIVFHAFLQPTIYSAKFFAETDKGYVQTMLSHNAVDFAKKDHESQEGTFAKAREFMERVKGIDKPWLHDLSNLFAEEECEGIFLDLLHVTEKGNRMIAGTIYEYIKNCYERKHGSTDSGISHCLD